MKQYNIEYLSLKRATEMHLTEFKEAVNSVVESGRYLQGNIVKAFEEAYAAYIGTHFCVSCANGLDALKLILRAYMEMGWMNEGDEIIVPANTYIASILAISECRLVPILVEPCPNTFNIDESIIEKHITRRTKGIMIVHLYGRCAFTAHIGGLCQKYGLRLIEDNAQAHGCTFTDGRHTGSLGHAAAHSFYPGKNMGAMGDAGAVTTDDTTLADTLRTLANYGSSRKYVFTYRGTNSRMDELQAAVLDVKLKYLDQENARRKEIAQYYLQHMENPLLTLPIANMTDNVWHVFPVLCHRRDHLQHFLATKGIQTIIHYPIPPHHQACYREWNDRSFPVTEKIHREELSIPCNQTLTDEEVQHIVTTLNAYRIG